MNVTFAPLTLADVPKLTAWLQAAHVRAFWDDGHRDEAAVRSHYFAAGRRVPGFIFQVEGVPVGFVQTHAVRQGAVFADFAAPTGETWGVDLFIGEVSWTGRGVGQAALRAFTNFWSGERRGAVQRFLVDPDARNSGAVRTAERAGFTPVGGRSTVGHGAVVVLALDWPAFREHETQSMGCDILHTRDATGHMNER